MPLSYSRSPWHPIWDLDDAQEWAGSVSDQPNISSDGSREPVLHLDIEKAGAGTFRTSSAVYFRLQSMERHAQDLDGHFEGSCHIFVGVNGMKQKVQKAECWGVMLALQAFSGIQLIDRYLLPLVKDGDL